MPPTRPEIQAHDRVSQRVKLACDTEVATKGHSAGPECCVPKQSPPSDSAG